MATQGEWAEKSVRESIRAAMNASGFSGVDGGDGGDGGQPPAPGPVESPDNGNMEARVARLEEFASEARERLTRVESKLDHVSHEVGQFKWWIAGSAVAIILTMIGAVVGTGVAIQQMTVATFVAAKPDQPQAASAIPPIIINVPAAAPAASLPAASSNVR